SAGTPRRGWPAGGSRWSCTCCPRRDVPRRSPRTWRRSGARATGRCAPSCAAATPGTPGPRTRPGPSRRGGRSGLAGVVQHLGAVQHPGKAERDGAGRRIGGVVVLSGGGADAGAERVVLLVHEPVEERGAGPPPLLVGHAGAALGLGGVDGRARGALGE